MKQPRLVLRDCEGNYCISGTIDPTKVPTEVATPAASFKLTRTTPTMVLYQEVTPCAALNATASPSSPIVG